MKLQFEESAVRVLKSALQDTKHAELTQEVKLSDAMPDIGRVLTAWAQIQLRSKEWSRDQIQVTGGVTVHTLYVPEDGSEPRCSENWIPFQMNWSVNPDLREGGILVYPLVRFADSRGISSRKLMLRVGIGLMLQAMCPQDVKLSIPPEVPEDVQLLTGRYPVRLPRETGEKTFLLDEEIPISESVPAPEKLIALTITPKVTDARVLGDKLAFRGAAMLHLVYRCKEGRIRSWDGTQEFAQIAQLDRAYDDDCRAVMLIALTSLEQDLSESGHLRLKAGMVGQYLVEERQLISVTEDAYSPFRDVEAETEILELPAVLEDRAERITASQVLSGQSGEIADVTFYPDFPMLRKMGDETEIYAPGLFQTLSYGDDQSLSSGSVRWERHVQLPADEAVRMRAWPVMAGAASSMPGPEGTELYAEMDARIISCATEKIPMVTALELGQLREPDSARPTFIMTRPGEDTLWTIAKRCGSTVKAIQEANHLTEEPVGNPMLLVPVS